MDPATWAAMAASMEAMMAGAGTAGTAAAMAPEALFAAAPAAGAFGAIAPEAALAASMMLPAEAMPFITSMAPMAGEAALGFSAPGMAGMEAMMAPMFASTTTFPWEAAGKAAMKGMAMGQPPEPVPRSSGGRPPSGGQAQQIPAFDYGSPTVQMPSMTDLMKKREEMLRRRMARGY